MINKKGLEVSFAWLFAILVGAVIIFLAIYASTSLVKTERNAADTESAKELGILLSPIETNLESAKAALISFPTETRIYNKCRKPDAYGASSFGAQDISTSSKSGIGKEWEGESTPVTFYNKYIFSSNPMQGREFSVFAKPFNFPFKVADIVFMWSGSYCFVSPPVDIEEEMNSIKPKNINISSSIKECPRNSTTVCFENSGCNIDVSLSSKSVDKNKRTVYYEDSLIYGAIFAEPDVYECQVSRLMARASSLALLYKEKTEGLSTKGCSSNLENQLSSYADSAKSFNKSLDFREISLTAKDMGDKNELLLCKLF